MTSQRSVLASLAIGFLGWFSPVLANFVPGTLGITALFGPIGIGAVGAAIGRGRGLQWLLLGFLVPPAVVLIKAFSSRNETSGFDFIQYTMLGLALICLGFYGWLVARSTWTRRRNASRDVANADRALAMPRLPRLLWWLRPNTFYADGSSAIFVDRFSIRYRERGRSLLIEQDLQADPRLVAIERASIRGWEPPHEADQISELEKDQIVENLRRAFATRGYRLMLLDPYMNTRSEESSK